MVLTLLLMLAQTAGTEPVRFAPGIVSTAQIEYAVAFTPSGDTAFFTRRASFDEAPRIWTTTRNGAGAWLEPTLATFTSTHGDEYPSVSPDGRRVYFASTRPLPGTTEPRGQNALWVTHLRGGTWSQPVPLAVADLGDVMASHPVEGPDGALYFHARRPGGAGRVDAYRAERRAQGFGPPQHLELNSEAVDGEVFVWPAGDRMVFYSDRAGGLGAGDLYWVERNGEHWSAPRNLGQPVNTEGWEWTPSLSADGSYLYFARLNTGFDRSDIYRINVTDIPALHSDRPPPPSP